MYNTWSLDYSNKVLEGFVGTLLRATQVFIRWVLWSSWVEIGALHEILKNGSGRGEIHGFFLTRPKTVNEFSRIGLKLGM